MDFLVFPLILMLIFSEQTVTCTEECPTETYKVKTNHEGVPSYTCRSCHRCANYERTVKNCTSNNDRECDCIEGSYYKGETCFVCPGMKDEKKRRECSENQNCKSKCLASNPPPSLPPPATMRQPCKEGHYSCGESKEKNKTCCKCNPCDTRPGLMKICSQCISTTVPEPESPGNISSPSPTASTTKVTNSETSSRTPTTDGPEVTEAIQVPQSPGSSALYVVISVMFLVLFWLLVIYLLHHPKYFNCWKADTNLEPTVELNEKCSHQGSSLTTVTVSTPEEAHIVSLNQSLPALEHSTHITPLLPPCNQLAFYQSNQPDVWPPIVLYAIIKEVPLHRWKEFLRLLSVADQQLERVEMEAGFGLGSMEKQYQMLKLWSQRSSAKLSDVFSALRYMELTGCAQLLQESLEKLQFTPEMGQNLSLQSMM
ncbi:uncharacterized protein KZ484_016153 isoform 2-T2 [Pholidichthys leucotaenia]